MSSFTFGLLMLIFVVAATAVLYTYLIYPALLYLVARSARPSSVKPETTEQPTDLPAVAVVLAAFNEEKDIAQRIQNLLEQDYPQDRLKIYIGSDGSSDGTNDILTPFLDHPRLQVEIFEVNRGKASVLNDLVAMTREPILVFTDANTEFRPDNIQALVSRFGPGIGGICGELQIYDPDAASGGGDNQDSLYWQYEQFLKLHEGKLRALPGANGANYAIRRELYVPLAPETIVDDFVIGCEVVLAGQAMEYAPEAVAREEQAPDVEGEFKRRVRIGSGNYQALGWLFRRVVAKGWPFSFIFVSHKVMRWLVPHMLLLCLATSALLAFQSSVFASLLWIQLFVYLLCGLVYVANDSVRWPGIIKILYFLVAMNVALGRGFIRYVQGAAKPTWQRTER